jgi:hypothetical protein
MRTAKTFLLQCSLDFVGDLMQSGDRTLDIIVDFGRSAGQLGQAGAEAVDGQHDDATRPQMSDQAEKAFVDGDLDGSKIGIFEEILLGCASLTAPSA